MPTAAATQVLARIAAEIGPEQVATESAEIARVPGLSWIRPRGVRGLPYALGLPVGVVRPRSADEIAVVLREAAAAGVPVVPIGGGTGLMGGALPYAGGISLDLSRMNRILAIERENRLARVEAGVILADLARAAEAEGLLFAHDPWSQPIATVGGAIGTNGVGYLAAGYGALADQLRGLEVVLPTGEVVGWPGAARATTGPELWRLFVGAEGTLGVVASAVIRLFPWPEQRAFAAFRFAGFAEGFRAIDDIVRLGLSVAMIDYEERDGPPLATPAELRLVVDGAVDVVRATARRVGEVCRAHGGVSRGPAVARRFWETRHDSSEWWLAHVRRQASAPPRRPRDETGPRAEARYVDVAVPIDQVLDYCAQVVAIGARHGVEVRSFGIWARPELVSYVLEGTSTEERDGPLDRAFDEALLAARRIGGSIEYVHGAGLRLSHLLPDELGAAYGLLRQVKQALDPPGTLNPGKLGIGSGAAATPGERR
jgi:FAD/FMN-containing dehydrogenase